MWVIVGQIGDDQTPRLTIDSREVSKTREMVQLAVPDSEIHALHSADFAFEDVLGRKVGVERKTISDFLASISTVLGNGNRRLEDQLARVQADYHCGILLLEGFWKLGRDEKKVMIGSKESGWSVAAMQMAVLSAQKKHGVKVLWTPDLRGTALTIKALVERGRTKPF